MHIDPSTTKYMVKANIVAGGVVEKPDVVGAIFGQTEGLLGEELDLRELQKNGKIGRIEVEISSKKGKSEGEVLIPSSLDQVETAILASALETIDRVGPCKAEIKVKLIEDVRVAKKKIIAKRAKELLLDLIKESKNEGENLTDTVRQLVQVQEIISYGPDNCPAGPNIEEADAIIVVEGRSDVLNLLKFGIKNSIAVEGTNVPQTIADLCNEKVVTAFVDGDRGGDLIIKELLQVADVDFIARAPRAHEVEELSQKQVVKALRNKVPTEQYIEMYGLTDIDRARKAEKGVQPPQQHPEHQRPMDQRRDAPTAPQPQQPPREQRDDRSAAFRPQPSVKGRPEDLALPNQKKLSPKQVEFKRMLSELDGSRKAVLLTADGNRIKDVLISDLSKTLTEEIRDVDSIVFDGIVTQRLLDQAVEKNIKNVVGNKLGAMTKQPTQVTVLTKGDLD